MRALLLAAMLVAGGCAARKPPEVACTMEVKACPDGSHVGRDPEANCAFRPCPKQEIGV